MPIPELKKSIAAASLCLFGVCSNATEIDITQNTNIKSFEVSDYRLSTADNTAIIKLGFWQQLKLSDILKDANTTHIAFYSDKLDIKFNQKSCVLAEIIPEQINYAVGFTTTVIVKDLKAQDVENARSRNFFAVSVQPLRVATGITPTYESDRR